MDEEVGLQLATSVEIKVARTRCDDLAEWGGKIVGNVGKMWPRRVVGEIWRVWSSSYENGRTSVDSFCMSED